MGWASGSWLFDEVLDIFQDATYKQVKQLVNAFEHHDADTLFDDYTHPHMERLARERGYLDEEAT